MRKTSFSSFGQINDLILHSLITLTGLIDFLAEADTVYKSLIHFSICQGHKVTRRVRVGLA